MRSLLIAVIFICMVATSQAQTITTQIPTSHTEGKVYQLINFHADW